MAASTTGLCRRALSYNLAAAGLLFVATAVLLVSGAAYLADAYWMAGLRPSADAHAAVVSMLIGLVGVLAACVTVLSFYSVARLAAGRLNGERRLTFEVTAMFTHYTVVQAVLSILFLTALPRLLGTL